MLRATMKAMGIIGGEEPKQSKQKPSQPNTTSTQNDKLYVVQYMDSAGAWHTRVYDSAPVPSPAAQMWGDDRWLYAPYSNNAIVEEYALTKMGAALHRYTAPRKARRALRRHNNVSSTVREFTVKK